MQNKTQGIVLNTINYNDKYILASIYTRSYGSVTYMISKTRTKKTKVPRSLFSPLAILEIDTIHQNSRQIQRIREARSLLPFYNIASNMSKSAMAFFYSEFLSKILKDSDSTAHTFDHIQYSIELLENSEDSIANFHMVAMLKLSRILGFYPNLEGYTAGDYFNMIDGEFVSIQPLHNHYVNKEESIVLARLARINFENMHKFKFNRIERNIIIDKVLEYYRLHLHDFPKLKSLEVLKELF